MGKEEKEDNEIGKIRGGERSTWGKEQEGDGKGGKREVNDATRQIEVQEQK